MRKVSALALLAALLSATTHPVHAQSVMLPLNPPPVVSQPQPGTAPGGGTSPPVAQNPGTSPNMAAVPSQPPNVPPRSGSALGSVPPVQGLSPDQIAQARRAFEQLAAVNPQAAALNPFARYDAMKAGQDLQKQVEQQVRQACDLDFFNLNLPMDFIQNQPVFDNFKSYGVGALVGALRAACADPEIKESLQNGVGMFGVRQKAGLTDPVIDGSAMSVTFSYDFTLKDPPSTQIMAQQMKAALGKAGAASMALIKSYEGVDQTEMTNRMAQPQIRP